MHDFSPSGADEQSWAWEVSAAKSYLAFGSLCLPLCRGQEPQPHCRPGPKGQSWSEARLDGAQLWGMHSAIRPDSDHLTYLHRLQGRYKCIIFSPQPS